MTHELFNLTETTAGYPEVYIYGYDGYDYDYGYYDYNYTYTEAIDHLPLNEIIPVSVIYGLIGITGLIGNLLVIFAIAKVQRMRSITNLFLLSLASADLLLVVVCVPVKGITFFSYSWRLGEFMCKFVAYIQTVSMICSALTLTAMSIERFVAIRYPLKARSLCTVRHARIVIIGVWANAFVLAIPMITGIAYKTVEGIHRTAYWCHKIWTEKPMYGKVFELYMLMIILVIPVSVMLVTYTWIAHIIWHVASRRADMRSGRVLAVPSSQESHIGQTVVPMPSHSTIVIGSNGTTENKPSKTHMDDDKTRKQVVLMLIVVVILFAVCWTPILVNNVLVAFKLIDYLNMGKLKAMRMTFHLMSYANSCLNPFVYAFMSKNFREGFIHAICACVKGSSYIRKQISARSVTSTTRASQSNIGEKVNCHRTDSRSDSMAIRRPSDMEDCDIRRL